MKIARSPSRFPRSFPRLARHLAVVSGLVLASVLLACGGDGDGVSKAAEKLGLSDSPPLPPEVVDLLCDLSVDTPCTPTALAATVDVALAYAVIRPGSHVRLWLVGRSVSDVTLVAEEVVPEPPKNRKGAKKAASAWIDSTRRLLLKAAEPVLARSPTRRSPLLEAASKVGVMTVPGISRRVLVFVTNALEYSAYADFEQAELIPADELASRLHADRVLVPGVLKDVRVFFSFCDPSHVPSSPSRSSILRLTTITDTWARLAREAGAVDVTFSTGAAPIATGPAS